MKKSQLNKTANRIYKLKDLINDKIGEIESQMWEEQEKAETYYEEKSETWQEGQKGEEYQERCQEYENEITDLHRVRDEIEDLLMDLAGNIENL